MQYHAFISYAHQDEHWAKWLQRSLERYHVPAAVREKRPSQNPVPARLYPIFRDRDELASSSDLSISIKSAIDRSNALIVICSPSSARSKWTNEEIRYFQSKGRTNRIFCLVVAGSPERDHPECAFPLALLQTEDGVPLPDPLAADLTDQGDGKRDAMLKIAAGMLGVGIDDLKQRDAQRRLRFRGAVAVGSLCIAVITIGLAIAAQFAREEAELRRSLAEGLISFMIEDLRVELGRLDRLDILSAVGDAAMDYFAVLGERGTEQEKLSRAMSLRQIGEVRFREGQLLGAQQAFEDSLNIAEALFISAPDNQQYLFELGQAEFWVGYVAYEQSLIAKAFNSTRKYMEYSRQLATREPENPDYQLELMYAYSNLGTMELEESNLEAALGYFQESLRINQQFLSATPNNSDFIHELGNTYSWLGQTQLRLGQLESSESAYRASIGSLSPLHGSGESRIYSEHFGQNLFHLGNVLLNQGELEEAEPLFRQALSVFSKLVSFDEENAIWRGGRGISSYHLGQLLIETNRRDEAIDQLNRAITDFRQSVEQEPGDLRVVEYLALTEQLLALITFDESMEEALILSNQSQARILEIIDTATVKFRTILHAAVVAQAHGQLLMASGDEVAANSAWQNALTLLEISERAGLLHVAVERQLHVNLKNVESANQLEALLLAAGFHDPRFL